MNFPALGRTAHSILLPAALAFLALSGAASAASPEQSKIAAASEEAMWWGDFAALDRQNTHFTQPGRVDPDGTSQIDEFRQGVGKVLGNDLKNAEPYLTEMDIMTLQWATANPKSALAHILHARALVAHGWSYRGTGYVDSVPPEAWKTFQSYLRRAVDYLKVHAEVALTDSSAHLLLLEIGGSMNWDDEQLAAIAADGLKRNPDDIAIYFEMMDNRLPKWGGNAKVLDTYINEVTEKTRGQFGLGMYARLYAKAAEGQYRHALFEDSHADWDKMKQGYEDFFARYPGSVERRNRYAYMACLAKDKATLLRLLSELGTKIKINNWGENPERNLESCRRWATEL